MEKFYLGIDPGINGAASVIGPENYIDVRSIPKVGKAIDPHATADMLNDMTMTRQIAAACIEKVGGIPGQSAAASFNFGHACGMLEMVLVMRGIRLHKVRPQTWKKSILADTDKSKEAAILTARNLYPRLEWPSTKKAREDQAEAVLLAEYCRRYELGRLHNGGAALIINDREIPVIGMEE